MSAASHRFRDGWYRFMLDMVSLSVHDSCMVTRTITLDFDAYEKLRRSKRPGESFSAVVRRAAFPEGPPSGADLITFYRDGGSGVSEAYLDSVEVASKNDMPPDDPWA